VPTPSDRRPGGTFNRRELLRAGLGAGLALTAAAPAAAASRRLLAPGDIRFLGAVRMPSGTSAGGDAAWGRGLAVRRVAGRVHLLSLTVDGDLYEVALPAVSRRAPYPLAREVALHGEVTAGRTRLDGSGRTGDVRGLFWDDRDRRLYWTVGDGYNAVSGADPSIGYSTITGDGLRSAGPWAIRGRSCKMRMGGVLAVPPGAAARLGGRRLAAGFGGYFSIAATGPASMGPALSAFAPGDLTADRTPVAGTTLLGYPFTSRPYGPPGRARRDPDYRTEFDGWRPRGGTGYFTWTDTIWQGGVWIETPRVHGVLFLPTLGNGRVWYEASTLRAERASHAWMVYDPADLLAVAGGRRRQWAIQPRRAWRVRYPGLPDPLPGWADEPRNMVTGAVWDPVDRRLYVAVRFAWLQGGAPGHTVHVYGVG